METPITKEVKLHTSKTIIATLTSHTDDLRDATDYETSNRYGQQCYGTTCYDVLIDSFNLDSKSTSMSDSSIEK